MANWKRLVDVVIPEGLNEDDVFDYIKNTIMDNEEQKVFEYFINEGLLRLQNKEDGK